MNSRHCAICGTGDHVAALRPDPHLVDPGVRIGVRLQPGRQERVGKRWGVLHPGAVGQEVHVRIVQHEPSDRLAKVPSRLRPRRDEARKGTRTVPPATLAAL